MAHTPRALSLPLRPRAKAHEKGVFYRRNPLRGFALPVGKFRPISSGAAEELLHCFCAAGGFGRGLRSFGRKFARAFQASPRRLDFILQAAREGAESIIRLLKKLSISGLCVGFSGGFGFLELRHIPSGGRRNGRAWRHGSAPHGRGGLRFLDCLFLEGSVYFSGQCKLINGQIAGAWIIAVSYRVFRICLVGFAEEEGGRHAHLAMVFT